MLKRELSIGTTCFLGTQQVTVLSKPQGHYQIGIGYYEGDELVTMVVFMDVLTKEPNYDYF